MSKSAIPMTDRAGRKYTPAVGPRLRPFLWIVLGGFAFLGANGFYLASISAVTYFRGIIAQTPFYMLMVACHLFLGLLFIVPFMIFGVAHLATSWKRPNRAAVRYGLMLMAAALVILISGLVLVRVGVFEVRDPTVRSVGYWLHVGTPILAIGLYIRHRMAGPRIQWKWARMGGATVAAFVIVMGLLHSQDPRVFGVKGPREGKRYFFPSEAVTATGKFIPARSMMNDAYCLQCHQDAYKSWFHSSHHFSSFNNRAYLASVRETRQVSLKRDGTTRAARWCAGCHDPVPFFAGEFDNPNYDDVSTESSQAGITCVACHSITNVNSTRGNAAYTIEEPQYYPFTFSDNPLLQFVNYALVKAKPEMHKNTFLKPLHKDSKFCSTCHKVGLPYALNHYLDFLRGQNHYDTFLLSGVSGHGARSFNYPPMAKGRCVDCHMNLIPSRDFGARDFDGKGGREIHNHLFLGANTGLAAIRGQQEIVDAHAKFLQDKAVRVDIFGIRDGGAIDDALLAPLRPSAPVLKPGGNYLVEVVVRTLGLGHPFTQGTADSNEVWVELVAKAGGRVIGHSGAIGPDGTVDPYSHFINIYMLDRDGNRIDRRNPQDIFVPLYNKQVPPGAGHVVHFGLDVPQAIAGPIELEAKINYRKFDRKYFDFIFGKGKGPELPVVVMARDALALGVQGGPVPTNAPSPIKEEDSWQRWNDYGIGLFLEGTDKGVDKGELRQAEHAFQQVADLDRADGWVNLARVYIREGRIEGRNPDARRALEKAAKHPRPAAPWVIAWLTGVINERNGYLDDAITSYESVLATKVPARGFDFSLDYEVINALGNSFYGRSREEPRDSRIREEYIVKAIATYRRTLAIDSENVFAHYGLGLAYADEARADKPPPGGDDALSAPSGTPEALIEALLAQARSALDKKFRPRVRARMAREVARNVAALAKGPRPEFGSKLEPLHEVVEILGPGWEHETDSEPRPALALALSVTHKTLHSLLKPDESAEGRAIQLARQRDRAGDQNAQSIVIHPLHRPGAPGLDPGPPPVASRENRP